jgi:hypothetical protein
MREQVAWRTVVALAGLLAALPVGASAETVEIDAARDATLIESPTGALANGAGSALFVGRTGQEAGSRRRALLAFEVAGALPGGARVTDVSLELELSESHPEPIEIGVHRVATDWSEGPSQASGGSGAPASTGDATWLHARYDTALWAHAGGDFAAAPSAVGEFTEEGSYALHGAALAADVQGWLDAPAGNHGWLLLGGEDAPSTVKRFLSRESGEAGPRLVVEYEPACEAADLPPAALGVCTTYCEALDCDSDAPRGSARACDQLAERFGAASGGAALPCELPPPSGCPCFTTQEVTALVRALQDSSLYTGLDCVDSTPTKPLAAVTAFRIDGSNCSAESADCSALAVTFTEDNACELNPPAPGESFVVGGISDAERDACRESILAGARAAGLACE